MKFRRVVSPDHPTFLWQLLERQDEDQTKAQPEAWGIWFSFGVQNKYDKGKTNHLKMYFLLKNGDFPASHVTFHLV